MDNSYLLHVAESKVAYHKKQAKMAYEEKVKIIVELQKIKHEFISSNKSNKKSNQKIWTFQV